MRRTLNVLFSGRDKFENGDIFAKREVLQNLGSNTILKDGKISINTYEWLEPIKNKYKNSGKSIYGRFELRFTEKKCLQ